MYRNQKNHIIHMGESKGLTKKHWILIITAIVVVALVVVAILVLPKLFSKEEENGENTVTPTVSGIVVREIPDKVRFYVGEDPDFRGLVIAVNDTNFNSKTVRYNNASDDFTFTGFDSSAPAVNQVITVEYKGVKTTFKIDIIAHPSEKVTLQKIEMSALPKTEFKVGDYPSVKGGKILCTYTDGTTKEIDLRADLTYGFGNLNTPGEHTITVEYREDGVIVTTTYKITVTQ